MRAEDMGCDLVEVTAHVGARVTKKQDWTNHSWWQGKVYSRSGNSDKYPSLVEITGYGKIDGLGGINCRHSMFPFFEGISKRNYTDEQLAEMNNKTVKYKDKEYGEYDALKMQRQKERDIRATKRTLTAYQEVMSNSNDEKALNEAQNKFNITSYKLKQQEKELNEFSLETGLTRDKARERVAGFNKSISNKVIKGNKDYTKQLENDKIIEEIKQLGIRGSVSLNPDKIEDIKEYGFDDLHINNERNHNISKDIAIEYIRNSKVSIVRWNGKFVNYYSELGATYINTEDRVIRTAFNSEEYDDKLKLMLEVLKKHGK